MPTYQPQIQPLGIEFLPGAMIRKPSLMQRAELGAATDKGGDPNVPMIKLLVCCVVTDEGQEYYDFMSWDSWIGDHEEVAATLFSRVMDLAGFKGEEPKKP